MNRAEHMKWCKERALEYVEQGDLQGAVASMLSDLNKHDETRDLLDPPILPMVGIQEAATGNPARVRDWIEGFAE